MEKIFNTLLKAPLLLLAVMLLSLQPMAAQSTDIPEPSNPPKLVNDFAGFLSQTEQAQLEQKLVAFNDSTSTQIAVVIVKSLNGYEVSDMAVRIIEKWKVGQAGKNNGIVILIKPKTAEEKGEVAISTGYGVESVVTDALSARIVDREMIPSFKVGQNYQGIDKAVTTLMSLTRGEFTVAQYMAKGKKKKSKGSLVPIIIIIVIVVVVMSRKGGGSGHVSSGSDLPLWLLLGGLMGSSRGGGDYGDFSSGGGGFGGFGGGSGGGGGASGSW